MARIVILAGEGISTWMVFNALNSLYPDIHLGLERPSSRLVLLKRRIVKLGLIHVLGQLLFLLYVKSWQKFARKQIESLVRNMGLVPDPPKGIAITNFGSVNSRACIDWLRGLRPDVVVLNGTRIISSSLLESCNAVFLNLHCGITPAYRGVHGGYWACLNGDHDNLGVTIHLVDNGIDTGAILLQEVVHVDEDDNFLTYPIKQYQAGIPLLTRAIAAALAGNTRGYKRMDLPSVLWYHPTLWHYLWTRWRKGIR